MNHMPSRYLFIPSKNTLETQLKHPDRLFTSRIVNKPMDESYMKLH